MKDLYVICDNIRSLENVGSIFRTADALGVAKIFLCGITARPPVGEEKEHFLARKISSKTALGAEKTVPFEFCPQTGRLIDKLKKQGVKVVALEQAGNAVVYTKFNPAFPMALVLGNEVDGVSKKILEKCDKIIFLPMVGKKESLNVSVAFGIAGYHIINFNY